MRQLLTAGACLVAVAAAAQVPTKQWDRTLGGSGIDYLRALTATPDGGYIAGGFTFSGQSGDITQPSQGQTDYWVVKLDAQGQKQWDKRFGGTLDDTFYALCSTSDGGYLLGGASVSGISGDRTQASRGQADYWVVKINAQGVKQWDARYGGSGDDNLYVVQQTSDGGYILAGESWSGVSGDKTQPSQGQADYWVVKIDASGTKQWDKSFGGNDVDQLGDMVQTSDGGYLLGGASASGLSGDRTQGNRGQADYWVVKITGLGVKQWDARFGGSLEDNLYSVQQTSDGGYILAGESKSGVSSDKTQPNRGANTFDAWVVKLDASGAKQWDKTLGGNADDGAIAIRQLADGGYLVGAYAASGISGDKTQPSQGQADYWLLRTDATGLPLWDARFGGNGNDYSLALVPHADGSLTMGGTSNSGISGDKTQASQGAQDFWLVRLNGVTTAAAAPAARQSLAVYPNPAQDRVTVRRPAEAPRTGLVLTLLDATGRVVWQNPLNATGADVPVEIGPQPAGLYLLRLDGPGGYRAAQRLQVR